MNNNELKKIIEALLMAAERPLAVKDMLAFFDVAHSVDATQIEEVLGQLQQEAEDRAVELKAVSSGWRYQVRVDYAPWIQKLWEERPPRYSRALLEVLALIAYRQPMTRAEVEDVRGVSVSTNIIRTLLDRKWVKVVGHRDVPGKPALYATTSDFLDHFNLGGLDELPPIEDFVAFGDLGEELVVIPEAQNQPEMEVS